MRKCTARKIFTLTHDFPNDQAFAEWTDRYALEMGTGVSEEYGLDSVDSGDAMGYWISQSESNEWSGENGGEPDMVIPADGFVITISMDWELFNWEGGE